MFFNSQADVPEDEEQQTIVIASTMLGQVIQALNTRVFANSPVGLVLSLDDVTANSMPALLGTLDEPGLILTGTLQGACPLPISLFFGGTFSTSPGALPEMGWAAARRRFIHPTDRTSSRRPHRRSASGTSSPGEPVLAL
jgi:hypothetical protein